MTEVGTAARALGRYALHEKLAAGGMATVHLGRVTAKRDLPGRL
jgi:hypothetical protein